MIQIRARGPDTAEILVHEPIGADIFGDGLTSKRFVEELNRLGAVRELLVRINSPGGAVSDGIAIYNALKEHPARIEVLVEGLAASIASVIAMAGDRIRMGEGALMMIHNPWTLAIGDADDLRKTAETLDKHTDVLVDIYARRTGRPRDEIAAMLDAETWMTGPEAVEKGFADEHAEAEDDEAAQAVRADHRAAFHAWRARLNASRRIAADTRTPTQDRSMTTPHDDVLNREIERRRQIRARFGRFAETHRALLDECLDDPRISVQDATERLLAKLGERHEPLSGGAYVVPAERLSDFQAAAVDALCLRAGIPVEKPHPGARDLGAMSVVEMARVCLSRAGRSHGGLDAGRVIKAALTTGDFPALLENVLGKSMRRGFESEPASHRAWVRVTRVPDFKPQSRVILGSAPELERVLEAGEYQYGALSEDKAAFAVEKYGRMLRITWEALVNDDLQAFTRIPQAMGQAARRKEADVVYGLLLANSGDGQTMQDNQPLFHSNHQNIAEAGDLSATTLGAARALLRMQKALGGGLLNLRPRVLLVPAALETEAEILLASATRHTLQNAGVEATPTPEWVAGLRLVVEPRLDEAEADAFYVIAGEDQIDTFELAYLDADGGPVVEEEPGFQTDTRDYKVRHVFGGRFLDWRGIVKVPLGSGE